MRWSELNCPWPFACVRYWKPCPIQLITELQGYPKKKKKALGNEGCLNQFFFVLHVLVNCCSKDGMQYNCSFQKELEQCVMDNKIWYSGLTFRTFPITHFPVTHHILRWVYSTLLRVCHIRTLVDAVNYSTDWGKDYLVLYMLNDGMPTPLYPSSHNLVLANLLSLSKKTQGQ